MTGYERRAGGGGDGGRPGDARGRPGAPVYALLDQGLVLQEEWDELPADAQAELAGAADLGAALAALAGRHLLTRFQAETIRDGHGPALLLGPYRLLEPLGRGGMGVVYRAEHRHLRRAVALKVMTERGHGNARVATRFMMEARAVARLQHPNIVGCLDAGRAPPAHPGGPAREYFVMDLVPGADLQATVAAGGPLPVHRAASLFRQVAEGLAEAHRGGLVHRDIKPSNIVVTPDWRAKVLDFGLARHPARDMTEPGALVGTVGYVAPEQVENASRVDARADLFGLGASLYLALTGAEPFDTSGSPVQALARRLNAPPPRARRVAPGLPGELDEIVAKLMDPAPDRRFPSASAAAAALLPFTRWRPSPDATLPAAPRPRVLVVDDDPDVRAYIRSLLEPDHECDEAGDGREGLTRVEGGRFDLVMVDQEMPRLDGARFIERLVHAAPAPGPMVLYMSGRVPTESLGGLLLGGADDFIRKPFAPAELVSRVRGLLRRRLSSATPPPAGGPAPAPPGPVDPPTATLAVLAGGLCRLIEEAGLVARGYHARAGAYVRALLAAAPRAGGYARLADPAYAAQVEHAAPAHDAGLTLVPATILLKPGRLDDTERLAVQAHAPAGAEVLAGLAAAHPDAPGLALAAEVARHHHERWDGGGYPDGLAGEAIPLAARVVAVTSVYDALRSRRPYRPGLSHPRSVRVITTETPGQFDPALVAAFAAAADQFDRVYQTGPR